MIQSRFDSGEQDFPCSPQTAFTWSSIALFVLMLTQLCAVLAPSLAQTINFTDTLKPSQDNQALNMVILETRVLENHSDRLSLALKIRIQNKFNNSFLEISRPLEQLWLITDYCRKWQCINPVDEPVIIPKGGSRDLECSYTLTKPFLSLTFMYLDRNYGNLTFPLIKVGDKTMAPNVKGILPPENLSGFEITVMSFWSQLTGTSETLHVRVRISNSAQDMRPLDFKGLFSVIDTNGKVYPALPATDPNSPASQSNLNQDGNYCFLPGIPEFFTLDFSGLNQRDLQALIIQGALGSRIIPLGKKPPEPIQNIHQRGENMVITVKQADGTTREMTLEQGSNSSEGKK